MINDPKSFCFWLQGYFELGGENLSPQQVQVIKDHLALVFNKVTPSYDLSEINLAVDGYAKKPFSPNTDLFKTVYKSGKLTSYPIENFFKSGEIGNYYIGFPPNPSQQFATC